MTREKWITPRAMLSICVLLSLVAWIPGQASLVGKVGSFKSLINLSHLDYLRDEIRRADGDVLPIWWVYCEPSVKGDRSSRYEYVEAATEGVACVDDVARAALVYLDHYEQFGDRHSLDMAKDAFKFIEYMQTPEGHFYNFVLESGARNLKGATSERGVNWWTARAMWALARGHRVFRDMDPEYAATLYRLLAPSLGAIKDFLTGNVLSMYGQYKSLHGVKIPAWFVGDGSDASAVVVLALCELYEARPDPEVATMIKMFADGIAEFKFGGFDEPPYMAHLPWGGSISYWHAWGSHQVAALARAGRLLGNQRWIESAEQEANALFAHMLASIGMFAHQGPAPHTYVQISYGNEVITTGLVELHRATGKEVYAKLAGISGSWLFGNNVANHPMYDPGTGRGWDGIDPPGPERGIGVSFNSGAESTIEALYTLLKLAEMPLALDYVDLRTRWKYAFRVVEAESFDKPTSGRPRKMWAKWTGENMPSGEFYVTARSGDSFQLRFSLDKEDVFIPYVVFEKQPGPADAVALSFSIDGAEPVDVLMGGSPDTKYFVMEKLVPSINLGAGRHTITVKFAGTSKTMAASLDAIVLQPMVEWRHMVGPDYQNVLLAKSFSAEPLVRKAEVDLRDTRPGGRVEFVVRQYDSKGDLAAEKAVATEIPAGAESTELEIPLTAFGYTLVEWR